MIHALDVLIPTCDRMTALAITLTSLSARTFPSFRVLVSDQSERYDVADTGEPLVLLNGGSWRAPAIVRAISWQLECPVCGTDCTKEHWDHAESFVADISVDQVLEACKALLGSTAPAWRCGTVAA